jgi:hypothetical protein
VVFLVQLWVSALVNAVVGFVFGSSVFFVLRNRIANWISARVAEEIQSLVSEWVDELKANPQALEGFVKPLLQSLAKGGSGGVQLDLPTVKLPILGKVPLPLAMQLLQSFGLGMGGNKSLAPPNPSTAPENGSLPAPPNPPSTAVRRKKPFV